MIEIADDLKSTSTMITHSFSKRISQAVLPGCFCLFAIFGNAQDLDMKQLKRLSMEELMGIEVTSVSKRKEKISQAASAIQVITSEDIRNAGVTSVPEALKLASNLQVTQVNASQWAISARGFNNVLANKLLVLIDGRVVYTPMYAGVFWDVQNLVLEDIDRIEVISGPGGTLWGANAVNGVINILTKNAHDTKGLYAEAAIGTELRSMGSVRYGGKLNDEWAFRIYGTAFKRDNTVHADDGSEAKDAWHMGQGGGRLDWNASEKDVASFIFNIYEGRPDPDGGNPVVASGGNALIRWSHSNGDRSGFQVQAFYDRTWRDFRNGFAEELGTYDMEANHRFSLGEKHQLIYGLGARMMDHDVKNLEAFAFRPGRKLLHVYNGFVQDEISIIPETLRLTLGIKIEHNTYTQFQYQPNVRLSWTSGEKITVWGAASRAVRNPSRIDREFYLDIAPGVPFIAGSDFQSEEVVAYELGAKSLVAQDLSLSLSAFNNVYDKIRSVEPGPPPFGLPITFGNGVEGNTYGAELSFVSQLKSWWGLRGGYTFLRKELLVKPTSSDQNNGSAESNDPTHQFLLQSTMRPFDWFTFGAILRYVGALPSPDVPYYFGGDVQLTFNVRKSIALSIVGQHLIQGSHVQFIPSSPLPREIEPNFYVKAIWKY